MLMPEDARAELERKATAEESAYERELDRFQLERPRTQGSGERRAAFLAHILRARDIGQRIERIYGLLNEDDQEWTKLPE